MLIGVAFYSLTIGIISSFFNDKRTRLSVLSHNLSILDELAREIKLPAETKAEFKEYLEYTSYKRIYHWLDPEEKLFSEMPVRLQYDLLLNLYPRLILDCPFFNLFDSSFVIRIIPLLKPIHYKAGQTIWNVGDHSSYGI